MYYKLILTKAALQFLNAFRAYAILNVVLRKIAPVLFAAKPSIAGKRKGLPIFRRNALYALNDQRFWDGVKIAK
jgi:hypothetical protein